ncbi:MAG: hypothetical protein J6S85_01575 [Methanobrevibacter sp.]|nr:hypothetical protein [Methanobrevibacter sp.]
MTRAERIKEIMKASPDFGKRVGYKMCVVDELHDMKKLDGTGKKQNGKGVIMKFIKNIYTIIRYLGFGYVKAIYENYRADKDMYENFAECVQEELYALGDCVDVE